MNAAPREPADKNGFAMEPSCDVALGKSGIDVAAALSLVCEEVGKELQNKARSELTVRLNDLFASCRSGDVCEACGKGQWEPFLDTVQVIPDRKATAESSPSARRPDDIDRRCREGLAKRLDDIDRYKDHEGAQKG